MVTNYVLFELYKEQNDKHCGNLKIWLFGVKQMLISETVRAIAKTDKILGSPEGKNCTSGKNNFG